MRVKVIEYWIEVARECINLGNFNSLMGIITGLNMTPVSRLRRTWSKIQSAGKFAVLEHQVWKFIEFVTNDCLVLAKLQFPNQYLGVLELTIIGYSYSSDKLKSLKCESKVGNEKRF